MSIVISDQRYEEIKKAVVGMLIKYKVDCVPVSGFEIATKMGLTVVPYSVYAPETRILLMKQSKDGFSIEKDIGQWFIYYNDNKDYGRINNTIMHENGHIVLDHYEDSELAKKEANFFAKYALTPPVLIHKLRLTEPRQIANVFDVSNEAADYAYNYYTRWLKYRESMRFGSNNYKDYEMRLLEQFKDAI